MNFISFDIETTGILSQVDRIVEIAAQKFEDGKVSNESFQTLVKIDIPMPPQAMAVNGITDEMLKDQPPLIEGLKGFFDFCGSDLMVAHNAIFDYEFLLKAYTKSKSPAPRGLILDTYAFSRKVFPQSPNFRLATLCSYLDIQTKTFHRALADATACGKLFLKILEKTEAKEIKDILNLSPKKALKFPQTSSDSQLNLFKD